MKLPSRRIGRFHIGTQFIENNLEEVQWLLSKMVILEAKYDCCGDFIEYLAICPAFSEAPVGRIAPEYVVAYRESKPDSMGNYKIEIAGFETDEPDTVITWGR